MAEALRGIDTQSLSLSHHLNTRGLQFLKSTCEREKRANHARTKIQIVENQQLAMSSA